MKKRIIKEEEYNQEIIDWEKTITIVKWTHDYVEKTYIIEYYEK